MSDYLISIFSATYSHPLLPQAKDVGGDLSGDGLQAGGTLCFDQNGNIIFKHVQETFSDHPELSDIIKAFEDKADL
ncbi:hypothetical protein HZS_5782 [Henneguya salminicola]|nr:hypothetical protein HZS_5782 [Henneguya salminicola]